MAAAVDHHISTAVLFYGGQSSIVPPGPHTGRPRQRFRNQRSCSNRRNEAFIGCTTAAVDACPTTGARRLGPTSRSRGPARSRSRGAPPSTTQPPPATVAFEDEAAKQEQKQAQDASEQASTIAAQDAVMQVHKDVDDEPESDDEDFMCLGECVASIVGGLLDEAVDDYSDEAVHQYQYEMDAQLVLPAQEPSIPEGEDEEADAVTEALAQVAESDTQCELIRRAAHIAVADAFTLSVLFDAASDVAGIGSVCGMADAENDSDQEDAVSVISLTPGDAAHVREEVALSLSAGIVGAALEDEEDEEEEMAAIDRIRERLRIALEESLEDGSLDRLMEEYSSQEPADTRNENKEYWPKAHELPSCPRRSFTRRLRPRMAGPQLPEELFPMDCAHISAPVAREITPASEIVLLARQHRERACDTQDDSANQPFFVVGKASKRDAVLSHEANEILNESTAKALQNLKLASRIRACCVIQRWYRNVANRRQHPLQQDAHTPVTLCPRAPCHPSAPAVPPDSPPPRTSGNLAGRRRMLGLRAAPAADVAQAESPATLPAPQSVPSAASAPSPITPAPPSAPRTGRPGGRPMPGCMTAAATKPEGETDGKHKPQPSLVPRPPQTPRVQSSNDSSAFAGGRSRTCHPAASQVAAPPGVALIPDVDSAAKSAANVSIWTSAPLPMPPPTSRAARRPSAEPSSRTEAEAAQKMHDADCNPAPAQHQPLSAMALDLGLSVPANPEPRAEQSATVMSKSSWPLSPEIARTCKAVGTGLLPALPQSGVTGGSVSWTMKMSTPRGARHKSIDRKHTGLEVQNHCLHGE